MKYDAIGILKYEIKPKYGFKCILSIDNEIARYYFKLIPKYYGALPQKYKGHITVIRNETIRQKYINRWEIHQNEKIKFQYSNEIQRNELYFWLPVFCKRLEEIREDLGLYKHRGIDDGCPFHITIGNLK